MTSLRMAGGAIFVGIAKNVHPYISNVLANVSECAEAFVNSKVVVVENDSSDGTEESLRRWEATTRGHIYIRPTDIPPNGFTRTERLAYFRNIYLEEIQKEEYDEFDYVVVFDCDNVLSSWVDKGAFVRAVEFLASDERNAAVFANTRGFYYDIWPLRHPIWCPGDCWEDAKRLSGFTSSMEALRTCVGARQVQIKPTSAPIPVISAFGGLAVYKRHLLFGRQYLAQNWGGSPASEHVALNESIFTDGGKLFIFPELLVSTPYEHIHRARDKTFYLTRLGEHLEKWQRCLKLFRRRSEA